MKLDNKVYNILKWVVLTVCPALCTLITGLGLLYGFETSIIVGTITLVTAFVGTLLGVSSIQYAKQLGSSVDSVEQISDLDE